MGAVATESISSSDDDDDDEDEGKESRLTVISADSMIDGQVTDAFPTLENLTLFMNAVSCNFDGVQNLAIEPKSLEVTYNTMQYAGPVSILVIFGIPLAIIVFGFVKWWKCRKA